VGNSAIDSVAVMPIVGDGGDPTANEVGDVITQRIINGLSRMPNLKVKSYVAVSG
jgi:TolB-like protein